MHTHDFVLNIVLMHVVTLNKINFLIGNYTYDVKYANYYIFLARKTAIIIIIIRTYIHTYIVSCI